MFDKFAMGVTTTNVNQSERHAALSATTSRKWSARTPLQGRRGVSVRAGRLDPNASSTARFTFDGTETGSDFADFLLGVPSGYIQAAGAPFYLRNKYAGAFAQDSWRARLEPDAELRRCARTSWRRGTRRTTRSRRSCPGRQSVVYPDAPHGLVFPGDDGHLRGLSPAHKFRRGSCSPRVSGVGRCSASDEEQHPRELRDLLHRVPGAVGRHHVQHSAVRLQLPEPGAAAVRDAVHHRRRRHQQRPAVSAHAAAARRLAEQPGDQRRLVAVPAGQRRPVLRHDNKTPVFRELHVLDRSASWRRTW